VSLFDGLPRERLQAMLAAGEEVQECYRVLEKTSANVVGEVLKDQGTFYEWDHYPDGDVYDHETHAQYYYHAHRIEQGEHGHFHLFVRRDGIPKRIKPVPNSGDTDWPTGDEVICHLIAISMEQKGYPTHLFTTNRWVTGENWYRAADVIELLDRFLIDHAYPSWASNRWVSAMVPLFRPQIEKLLLERDAAVEAWRAEHPDGDVFEDRDLEITSKVAIDVKHQIKQIGRALKKK
jgi:hypothetical protein|tara:strand:+ start:115 stop:819 length:705 start_codon:yes stop_codon:yes gene_type:complete